jgi:enhancing lycopene biosynthesis protein 2
LVQQQKSKQMKIGVIFSGSGVFDGTEIQEGVFTLLSIKKAGAEAVCFAPDIEQHHVINHMTGEEMPEKRNVLVESARITRGEIQSLDAFDTTELDALVLPGGFGAAKNLSKWAFSGPDGEINAQVKDAIASMAESWQTYCRFVHGADRNRQSIGRYWNWSYSDSGYH